MATKQKTRKFQITPAVTLARISKPNLGKKKGKWDPAELSVMKSYPMRYFKKYVQKLPKGYYQINDTDFRVKLTRKSGDASLLFVRLEEVHKNYPKMKEKDPNLSLDEYLDDLFAEMEPYALELLK